jgi:hypothetical protein
MATRKILPCRACVFWRNPDSTMIIGTGRPIPDAALGACHRRLQIGRKVVTPLQPVTTATVECSEGAALPPSPSLPSNCADCRYWRRAGSTEGTCHAWAPRWTPRSASDAMANKRMSQFQFPVTPPTFFCGDGISLSYEDPDDLSA